MFRINCLLIITVLLVVGELPPLHAEPPGASPVYQRRSSVWPGGSFYAPPKSQPDISHRSTGPRRHSHGNRGRRQPPASFQQHSGSSFQRPYPYHLDYYRMRYGGSYAPYFGNLYGPPQVYAPTNFGGPAYVPYDSPVHSQQPGALPPEGHYAAPRHAEPGNVEKPRPAESDTQQSEPNVFDREPSVD